jgi:protein LSM14
VRYEGVLKEVDPVKKSMTLINVTSFGTEGRRNGVNEIPVLENEIEGVQFKVD